MGTVAGTVKFFHSGKGYGFIKRDDGGKDVFIHARVLTDSHYPGFPETCPNDGDKVSFDVVQGERGDYATNISPL